MVYNVKPGTYTLSTSADLTDHRGFSVDLSGTFITLATGGQPAFDLTDSWDYYFTFSRLIGDSSSPPSTGILSATTGDDATTGTQGAKAGGHERKWVQGGAMWGDYQFAPLYHADRERARFSGDFANDNDQGYAFVVTKNNEVDIGGTRKSESSPYKSDPIGVISIAKTWVSRASFLSILNSGDGIVWLEGAREVSFTDTEIFGKNEPALVRFDATRKDMNQVSFDGCRLRVDDLDNVAAASIPFRFEDSGNGNEVNKVHITNPNITTQDIDGTAQPMFDVAGATLINGLTVNGEPQIASDTKPFESPNEVKRLDLKSVPVGSLALSQNNQIADLTTESLTLNNGTELKGETRRQAVVDNNGSGHAISAGQKFASVALQNLTLRASGSGNDACNTAGSGIG